jgi:hypothetical protein
MMLQLKLDGGPLDGEELQAEVDETVLPPKWIPVPPDWLHLPHLELDETSERCSWASARYCRSPLPTPPRKGVPWRYVYLPPVYDRS